MKRYRQSLKEILEHLAPIESHWRDATADAVIERFTRVAAKKRYDRGDLRALLLPDSDTSGRSSRDCFNAGLIAVRLFLGMSMDEFKAHLRTQLGSGGIGVTRYLADPDEFCAALEASGILTVMANTTNRTLTWEDLLTERLRGGRGSAIKGQRRGKWLEDFVEGTVRRVFGSEGYDARCSFRGATGLSTEKCDSPSLRRMIPVC